MVGKRKRILLVEDAPNWRINVRHILEGEGHSVEVVANYGGAFGQLRSEQYDLVIVDLQLSSAIQENVDGMEVVADAYRMGIRSIILTGRGTRDLARQAFQEFNVVDFIDKADWDPEKFREVVERGLGESANVGNAGQVNPNQTATHFGKVTRFAWVRFSGVLDNILATVVTALILYAVGVGVKVIGVNPVTWFSSLPSIIYILLSVLVVLAFLIVYTRWERRRR